MRRLIVPLCAVVLLAPAAFAQCPPVAVNSFCSAGIADFDNCPTTTPATAVWCPTGDMSLIRLRVQANGAGSSPCVGCPLEIRVQFEGQASIAGNDIFLCGTNAGPGMYSITAITDAAGEVTVDFTGGGCGCVRMVYWVNASACGGPTNLCNGIFDFCVKSPDITGDGTVNFFDTFQYLTMLSSASGYCGDFNCDGTVGFFDTFDFLPHLGGGHFCSSGGSIAPVIPCPISCP